MPDQPRSDATSTGTGLRDLVLHIGSGKTGTSSLQLLLGRNRSFLAQQGVLVPRTPGPRRHYRLGLYARPDAQLTKQPAWHRQRFTSPADFRADFERQFSSELDQVRLPRVLMSDEALFGVWPAGLPRLRAFVDRFAGSVRLVVYLRRQDEHLSSHYQQVVKTGELRRLSDRVARADYSGTYDYFARLRAWRAGMRPDAFVVRRYDPSCFDEGSLYQDFLNAAAIDARATDLKSVQSVNHSLSAEATEFLRILNLFNVEENGARPGSIDNRRVVDGLHGRSSGPTLTLPPPELDRFMSRWEEGNRAVAREFLGDPTGVLFGSPRRGGHTTTEQRLDPGRLDYFLAPLDPTERMRGALRRLAEREAASA
jgi:hypothetical protein